MKNQLTKASVKKPPRQLYFLFIFVSIIGSILLFETRMAVCEDKSIQSQPVNQQALDSSKFGDSIKIRLAGGEFDPLIEKIPGEMTEMLSVQAHPLGQEGYYIVQFDGPIEEGRKDELERLGALVFDYIPDFSFIVKMDEATRENVASLKSTRWIGIYQSAYRIEPTLAKMSAAGEKAEAADFIVSVFKGEDTRLVAHRIEQLGGTVLDISENDHRSKLKIRFETDNLGEMANIDGIKWIEPAPVWRLHNDEAAAIMGVPNVWNSHGLFGSGQVVAVADTGLDRGNKNPANLHDDFEDGRGNSRVSQIFDRVGDGAEDENSGHGTHVAGSVLGNGEVSGSDPSESDYENSYAGIAPEATLVFQALEENDTASVWVPIELGELFKQAYDVNARIHTNSWGTNFAGGYSSNSEDVDQFVWDHKDFLILFSAGNAGVDADGDGVIDLYSLDEPATAKNCVAVGATENDRPNGSSPSPGYTSTWDMLWPGDFPADPITDDQVSNDPDGMAAFSGRGPCLDGRFKPDIVAPGTNVISTKSSLAASTELWGKGGLSNTGPESQYIFCGGTSMSTPLVAGAAALVREFYIDVEGINPSAALIKATLLNGAVEISPGQYGSGAAQEIPDPPRPNNVEGWGRLDLENAIFPASPKVLRYHDEINGLTTGKTALYEFTTGDADVPLKASLVWSDYPGSPISEGGLVNDLDLILIDPTSNRHYPDNGSQLQVISYDDGVHETAWRYKVADRGFAVRFTPASYPAILDEARFWLKTSTTDQFRCNIWDDDGTNSMPGTNLFFRDITPPYFDEEYGWVNVDISGITITEGSFYIELRFTSTSSNNPFLGIDESSPYDRSFVYDGSSWSSLPSGSINNGNWLIRAEVTCGAPDRTNNVVGIDITNPDTGFYTLRVEGYNVPHGPQPYALVVSGGNLSNLNIIVIPDKPSNLSATAKSTTRIDLSWTDNSNNESGFKIERKVSSGTYSEIARVGVNVTSYSDTSLSPSTTYTYRVRAYNAGGDSSYSNKDSATTLSVSPNPPSNLSATARSATQIDLSWSDNSNNESGFKIERKVSSGTYSEIAKVGVNVTSYSDTGLNPSITYTYRVRAYNAGGDSAYSNAASVTTPSTDDGGGGSQDDVENFVTRFYQLCLGRDPEPPGLESWVSTLFDGTLTGSDVAYGFVFSEEFLSKNTTDEEYLQVLYEAFFNRQPDSAGKQGWLDAMQKGASREDVLNGFIYAQEFNNLCWEYGILPNSVAAFVSRFYQQCLSRNPERDGLDGWTSELLSQAKTGADVAYGFVFSPEFLGKNTSNEDYLTILYKAFFNREPDAAGWGVWLAELNGGTGREVVLSGFIYAHEFAELCDRFCIRAFEGHVPDC